MEEFVNLENKKLFEEEFKGYKKELIIKKVFNTSLKEVDRAIEWYERVIDKIFKNERDKIKSVMVFEELFMNAYEHGNLKIDKNEKSKHIKNSTYLATLKELEKECDKKIEVEIYRLYLNTYYIAVKICDEGEGFDFSNFKYNVNDFNGRGILMSLKSSKIYYNNSGNCVMFIMECRSEVK